MLEGDGKNMQKMWHQPDHEDMYMACQVALIETYGPWPAIGKFYLGHDR